ncbi:MAG: hypothetical protein KDD44_12755, partial [Bdellovibrionales bacterium]|nr:hypothetical protein [Bdellovibrionales bacterium]
SKKTFIARVVILTAVLGGSALPAVADGAWSAGTHEVRKLVHGKHRSALVYVPRSVAKPAALVLVFHGGGGNAEGIRAQSDWDREADRHGFVVAYPRGYSPRDDAHKLLTWNAGSCCGAAVRDQSADVEFVGALISDLKTKLLIDPRRIYATGHSNGAQMSYRLACELSETIAAIGPIGGTKVLANCPQVRPVPFLHIHGTADPCSKFDGGSCGGCFQEFLHQAYFLPTRPSTWECDSVPSTIEEWRERYALPEKSVPVYRHGPVACESFGGKANPREIMFCMVEGMGHAYPGGKPTPLCEQRPGSRSCRIFTKVVGPSSSEIKPEPLLWDFFSRHPLVGKGSM